MFRTPLFRDRAHAGQLLGSRVAETVSATNALVLALPRGGVPVGFEVAAALKAELDVFPVRKLGLPGEEELALGAIASGGVRVLNRDVSREFPLSEQALEEITARERQELEKREALYRQGRPSISPRGRVVVLVDDGLATGATIHAAWRALRLQLPERILVAVPVAPRDTFEEFRRAFGEIVCLAAPRLFEAVSVWYENFQQTTDEEVIELLNRAAGPPQLKSISKSST